MRLRGCGRLDCGGGATGSIVFEADMPLAFRKATKERHNCVICQLSPIRTVSTRMTLEPWANASATKRRAKVALILRIGISLAETKGCRV